MQLANENSGDRQFRTDEGSTVPPKCRQFLSALHHSHPADLSPCRPLTLQASNACGTSWPRACVLGERKRGKQRVKRHPRHTFPQILTVVVSVTGIFLSSVFHVIRSFPNDCALNLVKNKLWTYFHFSERLINQGNHKSLPKSVSKHRSVILSILNSLKFYF